MLYPRIIPCLLIKDKGLVKTVKFKEPKYVGDPINAVRIFNEQEVDELMVIDIDATVKSREPDYLMIEKLAKECRMPLCYGGGIKSKEQAEKIFNLGVEKIALSSAVVYNTSLIAEIAEQVGTQSVVVVIDVKRRRFGGYNIYINNGTKKAKLDLFEYIEEIQRQGAGEIVINSIDRDGTMQGYDIDLIKRVKSYINTPMTAIGGAGSMDDLGELINEFGIIGAAAGSLFVFKGKYKAVLINYPNLFDKKQIIEKSLHLL